MKDDDPQAERAVTDEENASDLSMAEILFICAKIAREGNRAGQRCAASVDCMGVFAGVIDTY